MVNEWQNVPINRWTRLTQRVNLLADPVLPPDYRGAAARRAAYLSAFIQHQTVVLLGRDVADAFRHTTPMLRWAEDRPWIAVPHPSGRNLFYNNVVHRMAVGLLLGDLMQECMASSAGASDAAD